MVAAVLSPHKVHVAPVFRALAGRCVSTAAMRAAPPSPAAMEACVQRKLASLFSTASAATAGQANDANPRNPGFCRRNLLLLYALLLNVTARPMTVCVTKNVIRSPATGMEVTALWL